MVVVFKNIQCRQFINRLSFTALFAPTFRILQPTIENCDRNCIWMTYAERTKALASCRAAHCAPATDRQAPPIPIPIPILGSIVGPGQCRKCHCLGSSPGFTLHQLAPPVLSTIWRQLPHADFFSCHSTWSSRHRRFFTPTSEPSRLQSTPRKCPLFLLDSLLNCCPLPFTDEDRHPAGHMCQAFAASYRRQLKCH